MISEHEIEIINPERAFKKHLSLNEKIFFSGKFGSGKSYFIENYFLKNKENHEIIVVSPINYEVNSNDDIFRLIKLDILLQITKLNKIEFQEENQNTEEAIYKILTDSKKLSGIMWDVAKSIVKLSPIYSALGSEVLGIMEKVHDSIKDNKRNPYLGEADKFLKEFSTSDYYYFSNDIITKIIQESIPKLNKAILIIEDLDRIEPGHIFRILNIFSAHYHKHEKEHKFGFNKVILVGDINNIEHIFRHIYGSNTDFIGYMDKFYTTEPFKFSNSHAIDSYVHNKLLKDDSNSIKKILVSAITFFESHGKITLRQILKLHLTSFEIPKIKFNETTRNNILSTDHLGKGGKLLHAIISEEEIYFASDDLPILRFVKILSMLLGGIDKTKQMMTDGLKNPDNYKEQIKLSHDDFAGIVAFHYSLEPMTFNHLIGTPEFVDSIVGHERLANINLPQFRIDSCIFDIQHSWTKQLPYDGSKGFLEKAKISKNQGNFNKTTNHIFFQEILKMIAKIENHERLNQVLD